MKKILITFIALNAFSLRAASESKIAAAAEAERKTYANDFEEFLAEGLPYYPALNFYLKKYKILDSRGNWDNQDDSIPMRIWRTIYDLGLRDADIDFAIAQIKAFYDFKQWWRELDFPFLIEVDEDGVTHKKDFSKQAKTYQNLYSFYFVPLEAAHGKPFWEVWAEAKNQDERDRALSELANVIADMRQKKSPPGWAELVLALQRFRQRNRDKISDKTREAIRVKFGWLKEGL